MPEDVLRIRVYWPPSGKFHYYSSIRAALFSFTRKELENSNIDLIENGEVVAHITF